MDLNILRETTYKSLRELRISGYIPEGIKEQEPSRVANKNKR
jgi:hypothetical protein